MADLEGGELHVLKESIREKKLLPCQLTSPLDSGLLLWKGAFTTSAKESNGDVLDQPPLINFAWQIFSDLKASAFLALFAHYRSATQILRPSLENIILSIYFQER